MSNKLDEIFDALSYGYQFQMSDYASSEKQEAEFEQQGLKEIAEARDALYQLILTEVIGEEYSFNYDAMPTEHEQNTQLQVNRIIHRQRQTLEKLFNQETTNE